MTEIRLPAALLVLALAAAACSNEGASPTTAVPRSRSHPTAGTTTSPGSTAPTTAANRLPPATRPPAAARTIPTGTRVIELVFSGRIREYTLHVPHELGAAPAALVLDFHGLTSTPDRQERMSDMRAKADVEGFVVAQPKGELVGNAWDTLEGSPDVAFALAVVADVSARVPIDTEQIFATGFSVGGGMANRLACDAADVLAGAATVAGAYFGWGRCEPSEPVPIVGFHGDTDIVVPYRGFGLLPDVLHWAESWSLRNGCDESAMVVVAEDVTATTWTGCDSTAEVTLYTIAGGGHGWPGTSDPDRVGDTTESISATDLIWEFFTTHASEPTSG